jgi:hypothetical protein
MLYVLLAAEVMDLLDSTIVNVAVPRIRTELGASTTQRGVLRLRARTLGRLADRLPSRAGRRRRGDDPAGIRDSPRDLPAR